VKQRHDMTINTLQDLERILKGGHPVTEMRLGEILIAANIITPSQLQAALAQQQASGSKHLGKVLTEMGIAEQRHINTALAIKLGIPSIRFGEFEVPVHILALVSPEFAVSARIVPLAELNGRLVVAMENPLDWQVVERLRFNTNRTIEAVMASSDQITIAIDRYYRLKAERELEAMVDDLEFSRESIESEGDQALHRMEQEAHAKPVVRLVNAILVQGIDLGASDIHIRPDRDGITILYRVDGKLRFSRSLAKSVLAPLVSRIKITGRMNIAERRLPQDGHTRINRDGRIIDLRISVMPAIHGESVVIRILDKQAGMKPIDALGLNEREFRLLRKMAALNNGIFLVTGPTGSGKSTTLYAVLNEINKRGPHIITVEDPVEYDMEGVEQIQVLPQIGYTFAEALRHILRHDPDVVMVGEIRDVETARIAERAALTGHLVLSTLHTNDAASAVTRMVDMGIEPFLVSATLRGAMAQRLIRLNCPHCKEEELDVDELKLAVGARTDEVFYRGRGCERCNQSGYKGRAAVVEVIEVTPTIARLINAQASTQEIKEAALAEGMASLTQNALRLAREGRTSISEVYDIRLE